MGIFSGPFSKDKKPEYPFCKEKAFYFFRQGVIAGGRVRLTLEPEGIVEHYSYVRPAAENECGMKDRGADIYFAGLREGRVKVTITYGYPTCEDETETFTLEVDKDLVVTKAD